MSLSKLPNEILDHILCYLSISDLLSASLLCRVWQARAFPYLYNTVYLSDTSSDLGELSTKIKAFARRVELDDSYGPLSISANVNGIVMSSKLGEHEELKAIISGLVRLRRLCWDLLPVPEALELCRLFQTRCPNLRSVDLSIKDDLVPAGDFQTLFNFTNLLQFSFTIEYLPQYREKYIEPVISLIFASPNLTSLTLNLCDPIEYISYNNPPLFDISGLVKHLEMPCLRTFRIRGCAIPNWSRMFDGSDTDPLFGFFLRHPRIEELEFVPIDNRHDDEYDDEINSKNMPRLFPSLKQFEGPALLCKLIIASTLAAQLKCLVITDHWLDPDDGEYSLFDITESIATLPRLRRLVILANNVSLPVGPLNRMLQAANGLEDLEIRSEVDDYTEFLNVLVHLPKIRKVTLPCPKPTNIPWGYLNDREEFGWESFVRTLASACPRLEVVRKHVRFSTYETLEIVRHGEEPKLVSVKVSGIGDRESRVRGGSI